MICDLPRSESLATSLQEPNTEAQEGDGKQENDQDDESRSDTPILRDLLHVPCRGEVDQQTHYEDNDREEHRAEYSAHRHNRNDETQSDQEADRADPESPVATTLRHGASLGAMLACAGGRRCWPE